MCGCGDELGVVASVIPTVCVYRSVYVYAVCVCVFRLACNRVGVVGGWSKSGIDWIEICRGVCGLTVGVSCEC